MRPNPWQILVQDYLDSLNSDIAIAISIKTRAL